MCIQYLGVKNLRNAMMDDDISVLASNLWMVAFAVVGGLSLRTGSGVRSVLGVQKGDLMRKHHLTSHSRVTFPPVYTEENVKGRKIHVNQTLARVTFEILFKY